MNRILLHNSRQIAAALIALATTTIASQCFSQSTAVSIARPIRTQTADFEFTGMLEPASHADVRAAVDGNVQKILVKNGELVKEGRQLVQLDDTELRKKIAAAEADLENQKKQLAQLESKVAEARKSASAEDLASVTADRDLLAANVQLSTIDLQQLRDQAEATEITAPLAGRIDGLSIAVGDSVRGSAVSATLICQITQTSPVRACVQVDQTTLSQLRELKEDQSTQAACDIALAVADQPDFMSRGTLDYVGSEPDPKTGQVPVCFLFSNDDGKLDAVALAKREAARQVRIRLSLRLPQPVLLVSDLAIGQDRDGSDFVLVANDHDKIELCPVTVGPQHHGLKVIERGLQPDQWVVLGTPSTSLNSMDTSLVPIDFGADIRFGNLRPGATVRAVKVSMPTPEHTLRNQTRAENQQMAPATK